MQFREIKGQITSVYVGLPDMVESEERQSITLTYDGIIDDRHYGSIRNVTVREPHYLKIQDGKRNKMKNNRQVSLLSEEEIELIRTKLGLSQLPAEWTGANIITNGIPHLSLLTPTSRLIFPSGAALTVDGINLPCNYPGKVIQKHHADFAPVSFTKAALDLRGIVAYVEREGIINAGDEVRVLIPTQKPYPML